MSLVALAAGSAALAGPALAQADPVLNVDAVQDSLVATGLPFGATTAQVTRPDALTGAPVVIGEYAGLASPFLPFSVNTTTPTLFNPAGDCWQKGKLSLPGGVGLTPDIRPGDTVSIVPGPTFVVPADAELNSDGPSGPIEGCLPISASGRNSVNAATGGSGSDVGVTGVAQPGATGVAVKATDATGAASTPVDATLNADGTWNASIPSADLANLADGAVTLDAVVAVPDVASGDPAHIDGAPLAIEKKSIAGGVSVTPDAPAPAAAPPAAAAKPLGNLAYLRTTKRIPLSKARAGRIRVAFYVPSGTHVARVRLSKGGKTKYLKVLNTVPEGSRQVLYLKGKSLSSLHRGLYTLSVSVGPSQSQLVSSVKRPLRVK